MIVRQSRAINRWACLAALALMPASLATAREQIVDANDDPANPSAFTLDFGAGLGRTTAGITRTTYQIAVDQTNGTARFVSYNQEIDPLILPGGFSTGNLIVQVVPGSSSGSFNAATGEFNTSEIYAIFFEGDLSAFQLESPVLLPSNSNGTINFGRARNGNIQLDWFGGSELINPFDPTSFIQFTYVCNVNTVFGPERADAEVAGLFAAVADLGLNPKDADGYNQLLQSASDGLVRNNRTAALSALSTFVQTVKSDRGTLLTEQEADTLSQQTLNIIRNLMIQMDSRSTSSDGGSIRPVRGR